MKNKASTGPAAFVSANAKRISKLVSEGLTSPTKIMKVICREQKETPSETLRKAISTFIYSRGLIKRPGKTDKVKWEENFKDGTASFDYSGLKKLQTEEDVIKFANIDTKVWKSVKQIANKWGDNYQIKVIFERIQKEQELLHQFEEAKNKLIKHLKGRQKLVPTKKAESSKIGVIPLADFHIGAYVRNLIKTPDYDLSKVTNMLDEVAETVNEVNYSKVHVALLGDFIESFTGTNHPSTWKELLPGGFGSSILITAYEILENFLLKINNLEAVYIVSGNHDRVTSSNLQDQHGEVAEILAYFLRRHTNIAVEYNPMLITSVIDNICYIFTHGHHNFTKKSIEHIIWKYGIQGHFNIVLQGHWHTRRKKEPVTNMQTIYSDSGDYRGITCPSLFTGNYYSETGGWTSSPGFLLLQNRHNRPMVFDIPLY